jgi:CheY-like chemotaxis protein/predicted regulator of Ras-like GTPase activity (Roadblock/LC7/MglB family)
MIKKRILIVDDDQDILRMLEYGLKKLGPEYEICTAKDIFSAIDEIEEFHFDLVLTDYMMPGMTGVDLARAARRMSPDTQVVLMTAYGTNKLRNTTDHLGFDGYLNKPFTMEQIRHVVQHSGHQLEPEEVSSPRPAEEVTPVDIETPSPPGDLSVEDHLLQLQKNAGTRCVIIIDSEGIPVQITGPIDGSKIDYICALIAANFFSSAELSSLVDNQEIFAASFFEGDAYNLYVCNINGEYLLAMVFDSRLRPGVVWFYAKQTAAALAPLLK